MNMNLTSIELSYFSKFIFSGVDEGGSGDEDEKNFEKGMEMLLTFVPI